MIGKVFKKSSGSFRGRIRYIFGCTKHDHEISQIAFIDSNCMTRNPLPGVLAGDESVLSEMIEEFDSIEKLRSACIDSDKQIRPCFHAMLSLRPGESLEAPQWREAVRGYMKDMGFDDSTKYVAVMHRDKDHEHVHIVANRIRLDETFSMVKDSNERTRSIESVSDIEDRFGLQKAPQPHQTWGVAISHAELKASEQSMSIPLKHRMIAKIAGAIEHTVDNQGDMIDLVRALRKQKVYVHLKLDHGGQPVGISYEFDGKIISGRQLKRSRLTWQKLIKQEGINYDAEAILELQKEIARRDTEEQTRLRVYFYEFNCRERKKRLYIRFTAKQIEVFKMIEEMLKLIEKIFGGGFTAKETRPTKRYIDFVSLADLQDFLTQQAEPAL